MEGSWTFEVGGWFTYYERQNANSVHELVCLVTEWITGQPSLLAEIAGWPRIAGGG